MSASAALPYYGNLLLVKKKKAISLFCVFQASRQFRKKYCSLPPLEHITQALSGRALWGLLASNRSLVFSLLRATMQRGNSKRFLIKCLGFILKQQILWLMWKLSTFELFLWMIMMFQFQYGKYFLSFCYYIRFHSFGAFAMPLIWMHGFIFLVLLSADAFWFGSKKTGITVCSGFCPKLLYQ